MPFNSPVVSPCVNNSLKAKLEMKRWRLQTATVLTYLLAQHNLALVKYCKTYHLGDEY